MSASEFATLFQQLHGAFASFALCDDFALAATIPFLSTFLNNILLTFSSDHLTLSVPQLVLQDMTIQRSEGLRTTCRSRLHFHAIVIWLKLCTEMILAFSLVHSFHINVSSKDLHSQGGSTLTDNIDKTTLADLVFRGLPGLLGLCGCRSSNSLQMVFG